MKTVSITRHTARVDHSSRCYACDLPIRKGDRYIRGSYAMDDRIWSNCVHVECEQGGEEYVKDNGQRADEDGLDPAYLRDELRGEGDDARVTAEWREWYRQRCQDEAARKIGW